MRVVLLCFTKQRRHTVMRIADSLVAAGVDSVTIVTNDPVPWLDPEDPPSVSRSVHLEWLIDREADDPAHRVQRTLTHTMPSAALRVVRPVADKVVAMRGGAAAPAPAALPPAPAPAVDDDEPDETSLEDSATEKAEESVAADDFATPDREEPTPIEKPRAAPEITPVAAAAPAAATPARKSRSRLGKALQVYRKGLRPVQHAVRPRMLAAIMERHFWPDLQPGPDLVVVSTEPYAITAASRIAAMHPEMTVLVSLDPVEIGVASGLSPDAIDT